VADAVAEIDAEGVKDGEALTDALELTGGVAVPVLDSVAAEEGDTELLLVMVAVPLAVSVLVGDGVELVDAVTDAVTCKIIREGMNGEAERRMGRKSYVSVVSQNRTAEDGVAVPVGDVVDCAVCVVVKVAEAEGVGVADAVAVPLGVTVEVMDDERVPVVEADAVSVAVGVCMRGKGRGVCILLWAWVSA